jgi:hypothetical protein
MRDEPNVVPALRARNWRARSVCGAVKALSGTDYLDQLATIDEHNAIGGRAHEALCFATIKIVLSSHRSSSNTRSTPAHQPGIDLDIPTAPVETSSTRCARPVSLNT